MSHKLTAAAQSVLITRSGPEALPSVVPAHPPRDPYLDPAGGCARRPRSRGGKAGLRGVNGAVLHPFARPRLSLLMQGSVNSDLPWDAPRVLPRVRDPPAILSLQARVGFLVREPSSFLASSLGERLR